VYSSRRDLHRQRSETSRLPVSGLLARGQVEASYSYLQKDSATEAQDILSIDEVQGWLRSLKSGGQ